VFACGCRARHASALFSKPCKAIKEHFAGLLAHDVLHPRLDPVDSIQRQLRVTESTILFDLVAYVVFLVLANAVKSVLLKGNSLVECGVL